MTITAESLRAAVTDCTYEIHYGNNPDGSGQYDVDWGTVQKALALPAVLTADTVAHVVGLYTEVHPDDDDIFSTDWIAAAAMLADIHDAYDLDNELVQSRHVSVDADGNV
jgi:hypothetical protein